MHKKRPFLILVTAGGTQEDIDAVRSITNHATGRLGSMIADAFSQAGATVTYLCGETALLPSSHGCEVIKIRTVSQLIDRLDALLRKNAYDCVIHSMAVSDFTPHAITTLADMTQSIRHALDDPVAACKTDARIKNALVNSAGQPTTGSKVSSKSPYMIMVLKQTPKVIAHIKKLRPHTLLVGFKLLSGASEPALINAGLDLMVDNACDYVLANDLTGISGDAHNALLLDKSGVKRRAHTKQEIARMIFEVVTKQLNEAIYGKDNAANDNDNSWNYRQHSGI